MHELKFGELNGKLVVTWDEEGKRRRFRLDAKSMPEAIIEGRKIYLHQMSLRPQQVKVSDCFTSYQKEIGKRPYGKVLSNSWPHIGPYFGHLSPQDISDELVQDYSEKRRQTFRERNHREMSTTTLRHELNALKLAIRHMKKAGLIETEPSFKLPPAAEPKRQGLSKADVHKVLEAATEPHVRLVILLMFSTGARLGAALDLTWDRVDFKNGVIDLALPEAQRRNRRMKRRAKVPMNAGLMAALQAQRQKAKSPFVIEYRGKPVASVKTAFNTLRKRTEIEHFSPHVCRHTAAAHMLRKSPVNVVAKFLGHSSSAVTELIYSNFIPSFLQAEAAALDFVQNDEGEAK